MPEELEPMLKWFRFDHLRPGLVADTSAEFSSLAHGVVDALPRSPERTVALRKLLEAKDAAVRCAVEAAQAQGPDGREDREKFH